MPGNADAFEQGLGARMCVGFLPDRRRQAQDGAENTAGGPRVSPDQHILQRGHFGKQADVLERARQPRLQDLMRLAAVDADSAQAHFAAIDGVEAGQGIEQGGLARAVGSDEAENLARIDLQRHIGQRLQAAESLAYAGDAQQRTHLPASANSRRRRVEGTSPAGR